MIYDSLPAVCMDSNENIQQTKNTYASYEIFERNLN